MSNTLMRIGFLPLVDAALPVLAHELGFAEDEGLDLQLVRDITWAAVRDRLMYGQTDAAHMVAPLAIATALGCDRPAVPLAVPFVLGLNGNALTVSTALADALSLDNTLGDPFEIGARLKLEAERRVAIGKPLRFGVVHRYSSHNYMLRYWLAGVGIQPDRDVEITVTSPPFAADALACGDVDGICVGEPWNSIAVDRGVGRIMLATAQIWRRGVEKVLAVRLDGPQADTDATERLVRALHRAAAHFVEPANTEANAAILSRSEYLDAPRETILRATTDRIRLTQGADAIHYPDFMFQHREAANFPWRSQAMWLYSQMARWGHAEASEAGFAGAAQVFRPDIYRSALAGTDAILPGASAKVEGANSVPRGASSQTGRLILGEDQFFDRVQFDPDRAMDYLEHQRTKPMI